MTVEEVLRQSGFTNEQIGALEPRAITAFSNVLSEAEQTRNQAALERQANATFYDEQIAPALVNWADEKSKYDAELAYYRAQGASLRGSGFDAPEYQQTRDPGSGRYVPNVPGATPGSPQFFDVNRIYERAGDAIGILSDIQWEHQRLFGEPLPVSPTELVRRADAVKLDPRTYAARTFNWDQRKKEMTEKRQQEHDAKIRADAVAERDKVWAERIGSNPDVRMPMQNPRFTDIQRGVKAGLRPDPLALGESERRMATRAGIRADMAEEAR